MYFTRQHFFFLSFRNYVEYLKRRCNGLRKKQQRIKKVEDELKAKHVDLKKLFNFSEKTERIFLQRCMSNNVSVEFLRTLFSNNIVVESIRLLFRNGVRLLVNFYY